MVLQKLRRLHRARPFRPFTISLADGRELEVVHPELMALSPEDETAVVIWPQAELQIMELPQVTGLRRTRGKPRRQ